MRLLKIFRPWAERNRKTLKEHYGHDKSLLFRAASLLTTIITANTVILLLLATFLILPKGMLDQRAVPIFSLLLIGVSSFFVLSYKLVLNNKLEIARGLMLGLTIVPTFISTLLTGGFPVSVTTPSLMIPVVFSYCIYGGKVSNLTALSAPLFLVSQWIASKWLGVNFPDLVSQASPQINGILVIAVTFAFIIFAMINFDQSNRRFIAQAEASVKSKSSFLANMSHEIRTPMNGVLGFSEIMMKTDLREDQKRYMEAILHSGKSLLSIINDILDFSKIEADGIELTSSTIDFRKLVTEVATLFSCETTKKGIDIYVDYPAHLSGTIVGDPVRLRQVLMNLTGNAVKFTSEGHVSIKVIEGSETDTNILRVEVKDTGIGIPVDRIGRIFERFTQAESSTTQKFGGTGLGLTISQRLIELMGGKIGVSSKENEGSTFWFEIKSEFAKQVSPEDIQSTTRKNILFVTEVPQHCVAIAQSMLAEGYKPHFMSPITDALTFLNSHDFANNWQAAIIVDDLSPSVVMQKFITAIDHEYNTPGVRVVQLSLLNQERATPGQTTTTTLVGSKAA